MASNSSWHKLYGTKQWFRLRQKQLMKQPLCEYCLKFGKVEAARVVDHVKPHKGNEELFYNGELASLCKKCHDGAKQRLEKSGYLIGHDTSGVPLDESHHWKKL